MEPKSKLCVETMVLRSTPTWLPLMSLNSTSIRVSNSTATKVAAAAPPPARPRLPPASPRESSSGERTNARPPPMEEGLRLVTENEKKVRKLAGNWVPGCRNLTGREYRALPAPEAGTARSRVRLTVPLFKCASPSSLRLLSVKVPKSNSVVATMASKKKQKKKNVKEGEDIEGFLGKCIEKSQFDLIGECVLLLFLFCSQSESERREGKGRSVKALHG